MCPPTSEKTVGRLELSPCCIAIVLFHAVATGSERTGSFLVSDMHFFPLATVLSLPTPVCVCCDLTSLPLQRPAPSGRASDSTRWGEKGGIVVRPSCRVRSWALPRTLLTTVQCGAARRRGGGEGKEYGIFSSDRPARTGCAGRFAKSKAGPYCGPRSPHRAQHNFDENWAAPSAPPRRPQPVPSATGTKQAKGAATHTSSDACALH